MSKEKKPYQAPKLKEISIDTRETLGSGCRTSANDAVGDACNQGVLSNCDQTV